MERKLTLQEKVQAFIKRQPRTSGKTVSIIIAVLAVIVFGAGIVGNALNKNATSSVSEYNGGKLVKGTVVGDMMLGRSITNKGSKNNYKNMFSGVSDLWKDSDYVAGNLECVLLDNASDYEKNDKEIHINAETKTANVLKENGFTLVSLANNHLADFKAKGVVNTLDTLDKVGLKHVGAGRNLTEAAEYDMQEINGVKIATIAVSDIIPKDFAARDSKAGILTTKTLKYYQAVKDASEKADLVIANIHWGVEYGMTETEAQQQLARNLINWGVDVVIGSHPHVLQPVEKYGDGIIFYSMGNFVFDQGWSRTKDSMVLNYYVDEDGNCSFEITPIRIKDGYPEVTNNAFFKKRTYRTLTKNLKDSDYEVKSNTLLMKNAIKIDLNKNNQTDANADNTDVSNGINTTSDINNTDNNTTTKTNTQY
ncbi:CapA family protein [Intestinibacter bartlettii]|uniref:CapA family protein n=1 Tax=Intestinibacter bartlettii TaxID=261299 RepID=UPI001D12CB6F|nr:CapA family protein [Intestinibacter bartlettii]MCC2707654.1 CapA family protein [Intestinibacter bartlettii]MCC2763104.1 CapA family protein [Intestinibacter bartlettii]MDU6473018.1 CapA family protein [Intestinibacter bartlettii]